MKSYNDYLKAENKDEFIRKLIGEFTNSEQYLNAILARQYGAQENAAIFGREMNYITTGGRRQKSVTSANNQIANGMFGKIIQQKVQYTIGNGIVVDEDVKSQLPKHTDRSIQKAGLNSSYFGMSWAYAFITAENKFDFEVFKGEEFIPLDDEITGQLMAGVRFWQVQDKYKVVEFYELDGMTTYKMESRKPFSLIKAKTAYKIRATRYPNGDQQINAAANPFGVLPIVKFANNEAGRSDFRKGTKTQLDLYDIIMSDFGNNLQDNKDVYWVLENYAGQDIAEFKEQLDMFHAIKVGGKDADGLEGKAYPHTSEVPYLARQTALEILRKQIYSDQMALDIESIKGGSLTNVAIKVAQSDLDLKASEFEWGALDFVEQLLEFWKIIEGHNNDIEVGDFIRRTFINDTEIIQNLAASTDLSELTRTQRHPYAADDEMERKAKEQEERYVGEPLEIDDEETADEDTDPDDGVEHNPESRAEAERRAERLGFNKSQVVCLEGDSWCYIAPHGITSAKAKRAYAECRRNGGQKGTCAAVSHKVQD